MSFLVPYKWWVVLALILTVGAAYLGPLRPALIQRAIDDYVVAGDMEGLTFIIVLFEPATARPPRPRVLPRRPARGNSSSVISAPDINPQITS